MWTATRVSLCRRIADCRDAIHFITRCKENVVFVQHLRIRSDHALDLFLEESKECGPVSLCLTVNLNKVLKYSIVVFVRMPTSVRKVLFVPCLVKTKPHLSMMTFNRAV